MEMEIKKKTYTRMTIDGLNRIVIPAEIRYLLSLEKDMEVQMYVEDDRLIVERVTKPCPQCGR